MSAQIKISADTSPLKKSLLDVNKSIKDIKGSKIQIFSAEDKKFMKSEMKKEMALIKQKMKDNQAEMKALVKSQSEMVKGSEEELRNREKILKAMQVQAKLAKQHGKLNQSARMGGDIDKAGGGIGGMMGSLMGFARLIPGLAAVATIGYAVSKGMQANDQYQAGVGGRIKAKGAGIDDENFGSASELARVGLTEQDMIQRRGEAAALLGKGNATTAGEMRKASFERAFGLDGGTMTGISGQLRGTMGGQGANEAQMRLQATVLAAGIEDAIGPYLEAATSLLTSINENGATQTAEISRLMAQMTKDGTYTPEQIAQAFAGMDSAVKGATGEKSAFLQTAFARAGIGGGKIGATKFAMESGGIMGLDRKELERRGYKKELLDQMTQSGMFKGANDRVGAISDQMKASGQVKGSFKDITDMDQMIGMGNLAGNVLGIKDPLKAFEALRMSEDVKKGTMSKESFEKKIKEMQEGNDPAVSRLDKINSSLAGQTDVLNKINTNLMEALGKEAVQGANQLKRVDNEGIVGIKNVAGAINDSGATQAVGDKATGIGKWMNGGAIGQKAYGAYDTVKGWFGASDQDKMDKMTSDDAVVDLAKKRWKEGSAFKGAKSEQEVEDKVRKSLESSKLAKDIGKEVAAALKTAPIVNKTTVKTQMPDGKISEKTGR